MISSLKPCLREVLEYHSFHLAYHSKLLHDVIDAIHTVSILYIRHTHDLFDTLTSHLECRVIDTSDSTFFRISYTLEVIDTGIR